jgi:hypothetical protein
MPVRAIDDKPSDTLVVVSDEGFWTGSSTLPHLHHKRGIGALMTVRIEPRRTRGRRHEQSGSCAGTRTLLATVVVVAVLSAACAQTAPSPSTASLATPIGSAAPSAATSPSSGPTATPSATATPGASPTPTSSPEASPGRLGNVFLKLVELAAEDPSPGGTFLVIENDGATPADVGCWRLSTTTRDDLRIPPGSRVPAGKALRLFFERGAVANPDRLVLRDDAGTVIDGTPVLDDKAGDDQLFGRVGGEWVFGRPSLTSPLVDGGFIAPGGC